MTLKELLNNKKMVYIKDYLMIIIGTLLMSISINMFLLPNKITTGGASGIGTILYYLMEIDMSLTILVINIPLFIIAIFKLGFKFSFKSIVATLLFTLFLDIFTFASITRNTSIDFFNSAIYGGIILGFGLSIVFKAGASTGGTDLIASIIKKQNNFININKVMLYIDGAIILLLIATFNDINIVLYSVIAIYVSSKVIGFVFEGINYTRIVNIITIENKLIVNDIFSKLNRSVTITKSLGGYTNKEYTIIMCLVTIPELSDIKKIVKNYDKNAIIYVTSANEVIGNGFKDI